MLKPTAPSPNVGMISQFDGNQLRQPTHDSGGKMFLPGQTRAMPPMGAVVPVASRLLSQLNQAQTRDGISLGAMNLAAHMIALPPAMLASDAAMMGGIGGAQSGTPPSAPAGSGDGGSGPKNIRGAREFRALLDGSLSLKPPSPLHGELDFSGYWENPAKFNEAIGIDPNAASFLQFYSDYMRDPIGFISDLVSTSRGETSLIETFARMSSKKDLHPWYRLLFSDWVKLVKRGLVEKTGIAHEIASRPLTSAVTSLASEVLAPRPDNFSRESWAGWRIADKVKGSFGIHHKQSISTSWEDTSARDHSSRYLLAHDGYRVEVPKWLLGEIFPEELYGADHATIGRPETAYINTGSWKREHIDFLSSTLAEMDDANELQPLLANLNVVSFSSIARLSYDEICEKIEEMLNAFGIFSPRSGSYIVEKRRARIDELNRIRGQLFDLHVVMKVYGTVGTQLWEASGLNNYIDIHLKALDKIGLPGTILEQLGVEGILKIAGFPLDKKIIEVGRLIDILERYIDAFKSERQFTGPYRHLVEVYSQMKSGFAPLAVASGKELLYIADAKKGAAFYSGLKDGVDVKVAARAMGIVQSGEMDSADFARQYLNVIRVKSGETFVIPAGAPYVLGPGLFIWQHKEISGSYNAAIDLNLSRGSDYVARIKRMDLPHLSTDDTLVQIDTLAHEAGLDVEKVLLKSGGSFDEDGARTPAMRSFTILDGAIEIFDNGESRGTYRAGQTISLPAAMKGVRIVAKSDQNTEFIIGRVNGGRGDEGNR